MLFNKEKNFISAVVYVYNQENIIYKFLEQLNEELYQHFDKYEIICVNDGSTDKSVKTIKKFASAVKGNVVTILNMSYFQGLELSMNAGVELAIGDFVYEFDEVDINYSIDMIYKIYECALNGYDIVSAAPLHEKRLSSKIFYNIYNTVADTRFKLHTETFRILSRRAINRVFAMSKSIPYRKAVYSNCGLKVNSIFYECKSKKEAKYKRITAKNQLNTAVDVIFLYSDAAYKCSMSITGILIAITFMVGFYTTYIYISGKPVAGWTTTMLFLSIGFSGLFAVLTLVIKYLSVILKLIFTRQNYVIESIEKISN